ncbi:MAG: hypothetical protein ACOX2S_05565 [bacterium]
MKKPPLALALVVEYAKQSCFLGVCAALEVNIRYRCRHRIILDVGISVWAGQHLVAANTIEVLVKKVTRPRLAKRLMAAGEGRHWERRNRRKELMGEK